MKIIKKKIIKKEILGLALMLLSLLSLYSILTYDASEHPRGLDKSQMINSLGYFGIYVGYYHYIVLGYFSIFIPSVLCVVGYALFANKPIIKFYKLILYLFTCSLWSSTLLSIFGYGEFSGVIGVALSTFLGDIFGPLGSSAIMLILFISFLVVIFQFSIYDKSYSLGSLFLVKTKLLYNVILNFCKNRINFRKKINKDKDEIFEEPNAPTINVVEDFSSETLINDSEELLESELDPTDKELDNDEGDLDSNINVDVVDDDAEAIVDVVDDDSETIVIEDEIDIEKGDYDAKIAKENKYLSYKLPDSSFLDNPIDIATHDEGYLKDKADQLSYALNSFGVSGNIVKISPGPVITLFEIEPAEGVRVNKFTNLSEDLSRIMGGKRVRIIAPIPGSKSVGIELPNESPSIVYLKSIINSRKYLENSSKLKIALGKTTTGDAFFFELNKMPHLLVAGATGAGKSVCINTIIISILYNAKPDEVKFILMDPKKVELTTYKSLVGYHLITAKSLDEYVMTTSENSVSILNSAINEMERRFQVFSDVRVRNIDEYHTKKKADSSLENIPYVVVIIDELADLMMTSGRAIEEPITRLAQKARAVGMHLIVATQRPSVDVITGLIKSNFPARISFQVSSKIDSRTIIDQMGAEKLLGRGDMLFLLPGSASPTRVHNAYVTLDEIEKVMSHITSQPQPEEIKLPEIKKMDSSSEFDISGDQDELLKDAAILVVDAQQASVSLLQRKFRIGYSRAGRLVDELESLGIVTGYSGSKAREVLVDHAYINEIFGD